MNRKITHELEQKILELSANGTTKDEIAKQVGVSRRTVFNVLKQYRVPAEYIEPIQKDKVNIIHLISFRLLYFCNDYELLSSMFAYNIQSQKSKIVYIPKKITNIIPIQKIEKIISLSDYRCNLEYEKINLAV